MAYSLCLGGAACRWCLFAIVCLAGVLLVDVEIDVRGDVVVRAQEPAGSKRPRDLPARREGPLLHRRLVGRRTKGVYYKYTYSPKQKSDIE